jgi:hypothetical protein
LIRAGFDPAEHQVVVCPKCREIIPLQPYETTEWSIFAVLCPSRCGRYGIVSRFRMASGAACVLCPGKLKVFRRHPYTEQMVTLLREQGLPLYKRLPDGGIQPLTSKTEVGKP